MRLPVLALGLAAVAVAATVGVQTLDPDHYLGNVRYLASPELKGRATGSPEIEKAAHYIAKQFKEDGLKPLDADGYLQPFSVTTSAKLGKNNNFSATGIGKTATLKVQQDFVPFNFSARGKFSGGVVFAGYGITAPEYNYDDYAGLDAKGKFVLALRHEPQEFDDKSVFAGKVYTQHSQFFSKASNAKAHGALGVILVNDLAAHNGDADNLEVFGATEGPSDAGLPFAQIKVHDAEPWFRAAGKNLVEIEAGIDKDLQPRSFEFPAALEIHESVEIDRVTRTAHNVIGYLPGETNEYIIIGAHYDHLGMGGQFSLAPKTIAIHPGADDNASGTSGVLELAHYFSHVPKLRRGIVFMTFAGEELGLLGSGYFIHHPELPLDKAVAMINMDMIGRIRDGRIYIGGTGTGSTLRQDLDSVAVNYPTLKPDFSETGYGSSDHYSFTTAQIPVLFFFSGLHADYHRPSDTADKINAVDAVKLLHLVADVSQKIIDDPARPEFHRVKEPDNPHGGGVEPVSGSGGGGYGPWFGSVPDFAESEKGVKFADVTEGSPAAAAGLNGGDIMTEFAGKPVSNLYDFTYALRAHKPGDKVKVKVLRDGKVLEVDVTLRQRN